VTKGAERTETEIPIAQHDHDVSLVVVSRHGNMILTCQLRRETNSSMAYFFRHTHTSEEDDEDSAYDNPCFLRHSNTKDFQRERSDHKSSREKDCQIETTISLFNWLFSSEGWWSWYKPRNPFRIRWYTKGEWCCHQLIDDKSKSREQEGIILEDKSLVHLKGLWFDHHDDNPYSSSVLRFSILCSCNGSISASHPSQVNGIHTQQLPGGAKR
jgi:hypothetical protein